MLYTVVGREQVNDVLNLVYDIDPHAFVNAIHTHTIQGRFHQDPID